MTRHRFDPFSFLFGTVFIIVALGSLEGGHIGGFRTESISSLSVAALGATLVVWAIVTIIRTDRPAVASVDEASSPDEPSEPASTLAPVDEPADRDAQEEHRSL